MNEIYSQVLLEKAARIKLLICDVDGVLTDGRLYFTAEGQESKAFHVHDGLGLKLLLQNGVEVAVITGGQPSKILEQRMSQLGVEHIYQGCSDKLQVYQQLRAQLNLDHMSIAYVGDDMIDLPPMRMVGLSVAVANARPIVIASAYWRTVKSGGEGAVREVCDLIMFAQGTLKSA